MARKVSIGIVLVVLAGLLAGVSPAFAQEAEAPDYRVSSVVLMPSEPTQGETINVIANVVNLADAAMEHVLQVSANGVIVDSKNESFEPNEAKIVVFSFEASSAGNIEIVFGDVTRNVTVAPAAPADAPQAPETSQAGEAPQEEGKMRVGPSVKLNALRDVITEDQDALVDLFWSNSALNERTVMIELTVDLPSGLYLYSANGAMACAAGRCQGIFEAVPGSVRNMPIYIKADRIGSYFIHLNGRYWTEGDPDIWNPVSLSTSIEVNERSPEPMSPLPTEDPDSTTPWWLTLPALVGMALVVIAVIALAGFGAISKTVRAAKPKAPKIDIG